MYKISNFILKWLYLSSLIDDRPDILLQQPQQLPDHEHKQHEQQEVIPPPRSSLNENTEWKKECMEGILMYPPGQPRLLALDAIRLNVVQELNKEISHAYDILQQYKQANSMKFNENNEADVEHLLKKLFPASSNSGEPAAVEAISKAQALLSEFHDHLPQFISISLHSRHLPSNNIDPIAFLKSILLKSCISNPAFGIELCWLLEADVGHAWKRLFEHRQTAGRRLIVVLPADKAKVFAKIGLEKRHVFEFLQEVEQATAYGSSLKSLSLKRCCFYGDSMHFIDLLSSLSRNLRRVPQIQRMAVLKSNLQQLNRKLRRRMLSKGGVTLDVEDYLQDWPSIYELTTDLIAYSIHFPLKPSSLPSWPGSDTHQHPSNSNRVLNIVVEDCKLLSSRERCPILIHLEICDTGVQSSDVRLYCHDEDEIGVSIDEVINNLIEEDHGFHKSHIPSELFANHEQKNSPIQTRGGNNYYEYDTCNYIDVSSTEYHDYQSWREHELAQLHHQMIQQQQQQQSHTTLPPKQVLQTSIQLLNSVYGLPWNTKCKEIQNASPYGQIKGWRLASFIVKAGEDIRREALVMQIITKLNQWFQTDIPNQEYRPFLRPYTIMCIGDDAGIIECLTDAKSIDEVKKEVDGFTTLLDYFKRAYDTPLAFQNAQRNFLKSLVGYSLVCYILQIKDRHNANILLDRKGHVYHIDFGYVLGDTPKMAKVPIFSERAPFKLTQEFWDVIGGWNYQQGGLGVEFCRMLEIAFEVAANHADEIASFVEAFLLNISKNSREARSLAQAIKARLRMRGPKGSLEQKTFIMDLVNAALTSWGTSTYDWLQKNLNGYE